VIFIFETQLNNFSTLSNALTKIYGVNLSSSIYFCKKLGFAGNIKLSDLSEDQIQQLSLSIERSGFSINADLKNIKRTALDSLINIKAYRGLRRLSKLPVRGQRTHTNARTSRKLK